MQRVGDTFLSDTWMSFEKMLSFLLQLMFMLRGPSSAHKEAGF